MGMKINQIIEEVRGLAKSQGHWGRMLENWMYLKENDPEEWENLVTMLEDEEFDSTLDMILYFEEGTSKFTWVIDVTKEATGEVVAENVEDREHLMQVIEKILVAPEAKILLKYISTENLEYALMDLGYIVITKKIRKEDK